MDVCGQSDKIANDLLWMNSDLLACQSGNFELIVMLPLITTRLLESITLLDFSACLLADPVLDRPEGRESCNQAAARLRNTKCRRCHRVPSNLTPPVSRYVTER